MLSNYDSLEKELKLPYEDRRILELTRQVLSTGDNVLRDYDNLQDMMKVYSRVFKGFDNEKLQESIASSMASMMGMESGNFGETDEFVERIKALEKDNKSSFMASPLLAKNHMMAMTFTRKGDDFELLIINKGDRPSNLSVVEKYTVKTEKLKDLMVEISEKWEINSPAEMYKTVGIFGKKSEPEIKDLANQKVGNCFVKQVESAMLYSIREAMRGDDSVREALQRTNLNKNFVEELKKEWPHLSKSLDREFGLYASDKALRNHFLKSEEIEVSGASSNTIVENINGLSFSTFKLIFSKRKENDLMQQVERLKPEVLVLLKKSIGIFFDMVEIDKGKINEPFTLDIKKIDGMLKEIGESLPLMERQLRAEFGGRLKKHAIMEAEKVQIDFYRNGGIDLQQIKQVAYSYDMASLIDPLNYSISYKKSRDMLNYAKMTESNSKYGSVIRFFKDRLEGTSKGVADELRKEAKDAYKKAKDVNMKLEDLDFDVKAGSQKHRNRMEELKEESARVSEKMLKKTTQSKSLYLDK